jgi:hypothetical protein
MSYASIIPKIEEKLRTVTAVKKVYSYPLDGSPKVYPAVIFYPDNFDNAFQSTRDNEKAYRFRMWVVVNLAGTDEEEAFNTILPNVVDDILATFDTGWDGGTLDGHRLRFLISSGQWGMSVEEKSKQAWAELLLTAAVLTTN